MRTIAEFKEFYRMTLVPKLKELESKRKHISRIMIFSAVLLFAPAIISFLLIKPLETYGGIIIIALFVAIVIWGLIGRFSSKTYIKGYKRLVIEKIVAFVDEDLIYYKKKYVSKELFNESQLFTKRANGFYGDDYITGRIGGVEVEFSEVHAEYLRSKTIYNIFGGMFMVIHLGIPFKGLTVVVPDVAEGILGKI